jgi:hypothetical protein
MRLLIRVSVLLFLASALLGQNRFGQNSFGTPVLVGGFGNAVFPAGTPQNFPGITRFTPNAVFPAGGGPRLVIPGQRPNRYTGTGGLAVPFSYPYPLYVGGSGYDNSYAQTPIQQQPQQQPNNVTVVYPPQPAPVIVNQFGPGDASKAAVDGRNPESPSVYQPEPEQTDQPSSDHFLIALKDHTVYSVVAYWADNDTLHYFTSGNVHNQVSLSLVDRALTLRLNRESGAEMQLPADK